MFNAELFLGYRLRLPPLSTSRLDKAEEQARYIWRKSEGSLEKILDKLLGCNENVRVKYECELFRRQIVGFRA